MQSAQKCPVSARGWPFWRHSVTTQKCRTLGFKIADRVYLSLLSLLTWPLTAQVPACILSGYNEGRSPSGTGPLFLAVWPPVSSEAQLGERCQRSMNDGRRKIQEWNFEKRYQNWQFADLTLVK